MFHAGKGKQMDFAFSGSDEIEEIEELNELVWDNNGEIVKAGTLTALVQNLTRHDRLDASFNRIFLTTYEYFTSTPVLIDLLIRRFFCSPPIDFNLNQVTEWSSRTKPLIQVRVINILKQWLEHFWTGPSGPDDPNLLKLQAFANRAIAETNAAQQLIELVQRCLAGLELRRSHPSTPKLPKPILPRKLNKLEFIKIDPKEIARQLTIMESCMFSKLQTCEFLHKTWQKKESPEAFHPAQNVKASIRYFNQLSNWVGALIIAESELKKRTQCIGHLVNVATV
jgi:hypothetical protein